MEMDKRTWVAIALMVLIYLTFLAPKPPEEGVESPKESTAPTSESLESPPVEKRTSKPETSSARSESLDSLRSKRLTISNELLTLQIDGAGRVLGARLEDYYQEPEGKENNIEFDFLESLNDESVMVGGLSVPWQLSEEGPDFVRWTARLQGLVLERTLSLEQGSYNLTSNIQIINRSRSTQEVQLATSLRMEKDEEESGGFLSRMFRPQGHFQQLVWFENGDLESTLLTEVPVEGSEDVETRELGIEWTGFGTKYFFFGFYPDSVGIESVRAFSRSSSDLVDEKIKLRPRQIEPGSDSSIQYKIYIGPKKMEDLRATGESFTRVIDYGNWIGPISRLLLGVLEFFHNIVPNYGVAIILLTVLVKLLLFPLAYKAAVSMRKLQVVGPKMKELRDKYKSDPQRLNSEVMALYKREKVNPVGGCLPMLLQMPVFFALYKLFYVSIELRHEPFFGWINDLSVHDPYFVTPVLMVALMWGQQKITPMPGLQDQENEAVKVQRAMMKWMPFIFGGIMIFLPAGLTLYFLVNAFISVVQQYFLNKRLEEMFPTANEKVLTTANGKT